jgi:hypothetical protein
MVAGILGQPLKALVDAWFGKIDRSLEIRKPWADVAEECEWFVNGPNNFLWDPAKRARLFGTNTGPIEPTFQIQVNKAFEFIAIYGPSLYWRNPRRTANARPVLQIPPQVFGDVQNDPQAQQVYQTYAMQSQQESQSRLLRSLFMEAYLNFIPERYQLHSQGELAVNDALTVGRGVLFTEPYQLPGSDKVLVGSFRQSPFKVVIDPDAERVEDAWWIALKTTMPIWQVERMWKTPKEKLRQASYAQSVNTQGELRGNRQAREENRSETVQDMVDVWKVWSKCGPGTRLTSMAEPLKERLDEKAGDHCFLVLIRGIPYPLNLPEEKLATISNGEVRNALRWPVPTWTEGKWPASFLDFYPHPHLPYPIPPMAPGIGELKAINVIMSHLLTRTWKASRDFIAVLESARKDVEQILKNGKDLDYIVLSDAHEDINKVVQFLSFPDINVDMWKVLQILMEMFDKRIGLSDDQYGQPPGGSMDRVAGPARARIQMGGVRKEHMAQKVEQWQVDLARIEAFATKMFVEGRDVEDLFGQFGAKFWDQLVAQCPVERVIRDIDFDVEAHSARRPNRDRDLANINDAMQICMPIVQMYAQMTGNFQMAEWLLRLWGKNAEFDMTGMPSFTPPQPPPGAQEQQQMMMQQQQMQMQMQDAEFQHEEALKQAHFDAEQQRKFSMHALESQSRVEEHGQEMQQQAESHKVDVLTQLSMANAKAKAIRITTAAKPKPAANGKPKAKAR